MGEGLSGTVYNRLLAAFQGYLLRLNEEVSLDFDPTDADGVPDERYEVLATLFSYHPVFHQFDRVHRPAERLLLADEMKKRFFAAVIGDSDYIESTVGNY